MWYGMVRDRILMYRTMRQHPITFTVPYGTVTVTSSQYLISTLILPYNATESNNVYGTVTVTSSQYLIILKYIDITVRYRTVQCDSICPITVAVRVACVH